MTTTRSPDEAAKLDAVNAELQRVAQHQAAGRLAEAGAALDSLLDKHEGHPRLLHLKGLNLALMGQRKEGRALLETVLQNQNDDAVAMVDYGTILAQDGDMKSAIDQFQMAVEIAPNYSLAHANLGAAQVVEEQYAQAIRHLEKALELDGHVLDVHNNLAQAYLRTQRFDKAIDVLYKALAVDPQSVAAHVNLSAALFRRERHEAAEHHARRAIELAPNAAEAWLHLGNSLAASGRMDEASEALLKFAGKPPTGMAALTRLVHLRKTEPDSPELALLKEYSSKIKDMNPEQQRAVYFALGKAFDDLGDYDAAFDGFRSGNEINKQLHPFDRQRNIARAERLRELVTPEFLARCGGTGVSDLAPIFICGMPRSGTTLMDQMFSRHPDVQAGGELIAAHGALGRNKRIRDVLEKELADDELTSDDFARLGEDYVAQVRGEGLKAGYVSDKLPGNYMYVGLLAMALPRAKFLIMRRHPLDCLMSNYMQHFGQNQPFASDFQDLASVYTQFDLMAGHWSALLPGRVREVAYEEVVEDPEGQMRDILEFLGLVWSANVLDHTQSMRQVNTASVAQIREPIYKTAVARWRRYGPLLRDLANELHGHLSEEELQACGAAQMN